MRPERAESVVFSMLPFQGADLYGRILHRALPCARILKAFSLLTKFRTFMGVALHWYIQGFQPYFAELLQTIKQRFTTHTNTQTNPKNHILQK